MRRRAKWWIVGGVGAAVAVAAALGIGRGGQGGAGAVALAGSANASGNADGRAGGGATAAAEAASAVPLVFTASEVVRPERAALPQLLEFSGPLVAPGTAMLRAKTSGRLLTLRVDEGDRVRSGQVVGEIDPSELDSRVAEKAAAVESARADMALAERQHQANEGLAAQSFIASTALDTSRAKLESARAQWESAKAQLATLKLARRDTVLVAPIAGIVARRLVLPGEMVAPEQDVLKVVDLSRLELSGMVGTHEVGRLSAGLPVQVQVEGFDVPAAARIARIAPAAEPGTRSIGVVVALDNPGERFRAGPYAVARVRLDDAQPRLTVPAAALGSASGQDYVWTLVDGRLLRRAVTTGRRDAASGRVEILTGLPDDALVLAGRFDNLREGAPAKVAAAERSATAASAAPRSP